MYFTVRAYFKVSYEFMIVSNNLCKKFCFYIKYVYFINNINCLILIKLFITKILLNFLISRY